MPRPRQADRPSRFFRLRSVVIVLVGAAALFGAYLADTVGEATTKVRGVVVEAHEGQLPQDTRLGRRALSTHQILIETPSKTFLWNAEFAAGSGVVVHLVEGRFSRYWYIQKVESSAVADFNEAFDDLKETIKRIDEQLGR